MPTSPLPTTSPPLSEPVLNHPECVCVHGCVFVGVCVCMDVCVCAPSVILTATVPSFEAEGCFAYYSICRWSGIWPLMKSASFYICCIQCFKACFVTQSRLGWRVYLCEWKCLQAEGWMGVFSTEWMSHCDENYPEAVSVFFLYLVIH